MSRLRATTVAALRVVRRFPPVHWLVHQAALQMIKTPWGERFVRGVVGAQAQTDKEYRAWIAAYDTLSDQDRDAIRNHIDRFRQRPAISVVMTTYRSDAYMLYEAVASVMTQLYPHWELCIADDASPEPGKRLAVAAFAGEDPRIKFVQRETNGGIAAATNSALALATGEFVAFLDHDDILAERALYEIAAELDLHPNADLIFSDEDKVDEKGRRSQPHHKTDWNAELMLGVNAVNHLTVVRRSLLTALGGVREAFDGAQDHDLVLRAAERATPARIRHIPWVLYHWRQHSKPGSFSRSRAAECAAAAARAVGEHLDRTGQPGTVEEIDLASRWLRVRHALPDTKPLVSVIVPTRDRAELLAQVADGVLAKTDYAPLELLIVDNGSEEPATHALFARLKTDPRVRILPAPGPFNFSALNNLAAAEAKGEVLLLLNNDISMIRPDWLDEMVAQAIRPNVGAVGAKLFYPDGTLQHAGVVLGVGDVPEKVAGHLYAGAGDGPGYQGHVALARNVSAVTAACLAIRKAVYDEVGGMDEARLAVAFNDVDLCLKVREAGYDIVWTPHAALVHHESASRGSDLAPEKLARFQAELRVMRERWGPVLDADPFYGAVFDKRYTNYRLGGPPDRVAPWLRPSSDSPR